MDTLFVYLDESGDQGWNFTLPYRNGGSSRYMTIGAYLVQDSFKHHSKRLIKSLYKKYGWNPKQEKKWADMSFEERIGFSNEAVALKNQHPSIEYYTITVYKQNVQKHIRGDSNKLYNYMVQLLLLNRMANFDDVCFKPDARSIKVESGNSLADYLQTQLWFEKGVATKLKAIPVNSRHELNVQFVDMLTGLVQQHYEDGKNEAWNLMRDKIHHKKLYFPQ